MPDDNPPPLSRPQPEQVEGGLPRFHRFRSSIRSVRSLLLVAGGGAVVFGLIIWLFFRDLAGSGLLVMAIGGALLLLDGVISWREVGRAAFGRRGRYGVNTVVIVVAFLGIAVVVNFFLFWLISRPNPLGWLRVDTTATKQSLLSEQALAILDGLNDQILATAFFVIDTPSGAAAWQETRDLLSEFKRRSGNRFDFRRIDPELEPNMATQFGITRHPAIAIENLASLRRQVIEGGDPMQTRQVFDETDFTTALLVVNQVRQKGVLFITGHGERDITDFSAQGEGYGQATQALIRDNYVIGAATIQELGGLLLQAGGQSLPATVVIARPQSDLLTGEDTILLDYMQFGGSVLFLMEPETPQGWRDILGKYGVALGTGQMIDTSSFVAPNPNFLQLKRSSGQFRDPATGQQHPITAPLDVIYMPATAFVFRTVNELTVPLADDGTPYVSHSLLALTTLQSWEETGEEIQYDIDDDRLGPLPVAVAVEAISELNQVPRRLDGEWVRTNIVVIGDSDFASNRLFSSAKNGDLLVNSINWLARDFELISIRPKTRVFRELVLTKTERDFIRWTGWLLMPVLVGSAGVVSWWRRR